MVLACWLTLYSAVVYGRRTRRTPLVATALCVLLFAEVDARGLLLQGRGVRRSSPQRDVPARVQRSVHRASRAARNRGAGRSRPPARARRTDERAAAGARGQCASCRPGGRVRIARELHDVVAHHVSVIGVQAGAARRVMAREPAKAEEVLATIEASSRQAVVELHQLLGFLRREDQSDDLAPQPDLTRLPELIAQAAQGRLAVELRIGGSPRDLSAHAAGIGLSRDPGGAHERPQAFERNVRRSRRRVRPTALVVEVRDDGTTAVGAAAKHVGGHGLMGMRERVGLHGGHLRAGAMPQGGFMVHATFPYTGAAT